MMKIKTLKPFLYLLTIPLFSTSLLAMDIELKESSEPASFVTSVTHYPTPSSQIDPIFLPIRESISDVEISKILNSQLEKILKLKEERRLSRASEQLPEEKKPETFQRVPTPVPFSLNDDDLSDAFETIIQRRLHDCQMPFKSKEPPVLKAKFDIENSYDPLSPQGLKGVHKFYCHPSLLRPLPSSEDTLAPKMSQESLERENLKTPTSYERKDNL